MEKSPNATWKAAKRERYIQYLGGKCIDCGSTEKLEFDHVDPSTMSFRIAGNIGRNDLDLMKEIKKCQLLCKKCHVLKTRLERQGSFEIKHGKIGTYVNRKCRCKECTKVWNDYCLIKQREHRKKNKKPKLQYNTIFSNIYLGI